MTRPGFVGFAQAGPYGYDADIGFQDDNGLSPDFSLLRETGPSGDADVDGIINGEDNCPMVINVDQADLDGDEIGDLCDSDVDGDGLADTEEILLGTDPRKSDTDDDGILTG